MKDTYPLHTLDKQEESMAKLKKLQTTAEQTIKEGLYVNNNYYMKFV